MNTIFILAACLAVASAGILHIHSRESRRLNNGIMNDKPTRCCLPKHWQGYIGETIIIEGLPGAQEAFFEYAVKSDERMAAFIFRDKFSLKEISRGVIDYNKNTFYNITNGVCVKSVRPVWFDEPFRCIPDTAEYVGDYFVGGEEDGWKASYWRVFNLTKHAPEAEITLSKNCYPVYDSLTMIVDKARVKILSNFANVVSRIKTPEIFDVPASCNNAIAREAEAGGHHPRSTLA